MRFWFMLAIVIFVLAGILTTGHSLAQISFTDVTAQAGINNPARGACIVFVDYDEDGYVDIYVGNSGGFLDLFGKPNLLYRNNGDGTFSDVAAEAGVADDRQTLGAAFGDLDNDGDLDLYLANDYGPNALYLNRGDGSFEDITEAAGVEGRLDIIDGDEIFSGSGVALADEDGNGYLDIYVVNLGTANMLYCNNGDVTFTDITNLAGVTAGGGPQGAGMAAVFSDCNDDGKLDL